MKILPPDFFNWEGACAGLATTMRTSWMLELFSLHPSAFILAFHAASQETSRPRQFQLALRRAGEAKMIRPNIRKNTGGKGREPETNFRRFLVRAIAVSALSLLLSVLSFGQASTSIKGEIVDENGGKVSGADVRLRSRTGVQV